MNWRTGRPPEDGWYWMEYDGGRKRMERYWVGDKYNYQNYAELVGWIGPLRPEDAEELERLRATVVAKEKTLRHYEEQIAEDTQRIEELEAKLEAQFFACHDCLRYNEEENVALRNTRDKLETQLATAREENEQLKAEIADRKRTITEVAEALRASNTEVARLRKAWDENRRIREGLAKLMDGNKDDIYTRIEKLLLDNKC